MDRKQRKISVAVIVLALIAWLISPLFFSAPEPALPLSQAPLLFNASRAYQLTSEFPSRVLGSLESRQSTGYLRDYLQNLGYEIGYSHFDARIAGKKQVGRNVLAGKKGRSTDILALVAHFDTALTTVQGAMKNGAAVGVLLEMARVFTQSPAQRSLLLCLSDGGEWGALGAREVADRYPERDRIVAVLSLDYVALDNLAAFRLEETGQLKGFSPSWLRALARRAAEAHGLPVTEPSLLRVHFERALMISRADHGPFLRAGIPAINLGSSSTEPAREALVYHSALDTPENLKIASIEKYGLAAERILRSLDELPSVPRDSSDSFRLWDSLSLKPKAVPALHLLSFSPLPLIFYFYLINNRRRLSLVQIGREALAYATTLLPLPAIYLSISLFRARHLIPLYSLYPATGRDPGLENPPWGVLVGILGIALFVAIIGYAAAKFSFRSLPKPDCRVSKLVSLGFLLITAAFALAYNSYWASAFLMLPSWIWAMTGYSTSAAGRLKNRILILAAGIPYYLALRIIDSEFVIAGNLIWYQILALNTGLYTASGYFLWAATAALGIRFLAIQGHKISS